MIELDSEDSIPIILYASIPGRNPPVLVCHTTTKLKTHVVIEESVTDKLIIHPKNKLIDENAKKILSYIMEKGVPEPLRIKINYSIQGECVYPLGILSLLVKHLLETLEKYYEETFDKEEKKEIIQGILSSNDFPDEIIGPLTIAILERKNILYSIIQGPIFMGEKKIDCVTIAEKHVPTLDEKMDERILDLLTKTASIAIVGLAENICSHTGRNNSFYNKTINSIWYITSNVIPPERGIHTISIKNNVSNILCSEQPKGNGA